MFRTSSYSGGGNCIKAGNYRKSSYSNYLQCIEAGDGSGVVAVRDTKQAHLGDGRTVLEFSPGAWTAFTASLKEDV